MKRKKEHKVLNTYTFLNGKYTYLFFKSLEGNFSIFKWIDQVIPKIKYLRENSNLGHLFPKLMLSPCQSHMEH